MKTAFTCWTTPRSTLRQHELGEVFERELYPVLTPLSVDPGHPFPYISNLSLSLAVRVEDKKSGEARFRSQ